jgi:hypothetical protein
MRYVLYARKSTEDEDRQVLSIKAQLAELSLYSAKEKFDIVASFEEAKTAKEPGEKHRRKPFSFGAGKARSEFVSGKRKLFGIQLKSPKNPCFEGCFSYLT